MKIIGCSNGKKKVLNVPKSWNKLFIESLSPGFDFNTRWSKMPKTTESKLTNTTKATKSLLATSRNVKGGQSTMKRSKRIFEKDELEAKKKFDKDQLQTKVQAKHNAIVVSFRVINLDKELKNGPCKNYESYNALV